MKQICVTFFLLLFLSNFSKSATFSGSVKDNLNNPISGALVSAYKRTTTLGIATQVETTFADTNGNFIISLLNPGDYYVSAIDTFENFLGVFYPNDLNWNEALPLVLQDVNSVVDTLNFQLQPLNTDPFVTNEIVGSLSITSTLADNPLTSSTEIWVIAQSDSILTNGQMVANDTKFGFSRILYNGISTFITFTIPKLVAGKYKVLVTFPGIWPTYFATGTGLISNPKDKADLITVPQNPAQFVFIQTYLVPTKFIYGNIFDVNGSISCSGTTISFIGNQLDVGDSKLIVHAVTGLTCFSFSTPQKFVADVDGDRKITVNDASLILKKLNGLIQCFPVECQN